jgi:hypothetical protein
LLASRESKLVGLWPRRDARDQIAVRLESLTYESLRRSRVGLERLTRGPAMNFKAVHRNFGRRGNSKPSRLAFDGHDRNLGVNRWNHDPLAHFATENQHQIPP